MMFGSLPAVRPDSFGRLPPAMQAEGVRLMMEHGASPVMIAMRLNRSPADVMNMAVFRAPFRRNGDVNGKEDQGC